jgi:hypothetical protein
VDRTQLTLEKNNRDTAWARQLAEVSGLASINEIPRGFYKICGSDYSEELALAHAVFLRRVCDTDEHQEELSFDVAVDRLRLINRRSALRVIKHLPMPVLFEAEKKAMQKWSLKEKQGYQFFYLGVATWLLRWDMKQNDPALVNFIQSNFPWHEYYSKLSQARFELIRELCDRGVLPREEFPKPAFPWLLAEAGLCRNRILQTHSSKRHAYEASVKRRRTICDFEGGVKFFLGLPREQEWMNSWGSFLAKFPRYIEVAARAVAEDDVKFRELYFQPYIDFEKKWSSNAYRLKTVGVPGEKQKPGSKLGQKYFPKGG